MTISRLTSAWDKVLAVCVVSKTRRGWTMRLMLPFSWLLLFGAFIQFHLIYAIALFRINGRTQGGVLQGCSVDYRVVNPPCV